MSVEKHAIEEVLPRPFPEITLFVKFEILPVVEISINRLGKKHRILVR